MKKYLFFVFLLFIFSAKSVLAAEPVVKVRDAAYAAKFVSQSITDPIEIPQGETKEVVIKFKNVGTATWNGSGSRFISAYTMEPRARVSLFRYSGWLSGEQTGKISGTVKPGEVGELEISLKAPNKIGKYLEKFYLAAENYTWLKGGYFYLEIVVKEKAKISRTAEAATSSTGTDSSYQAQVVVLSKKSAQAAGGEIIKLVAGVQNKGASAWQEFKLTGNKEFADTSWSTEMNIISGLEEILPDKFWRKEFYFRAPPQAGTYTAEFLLSLDDGKGQATISLPIIVTADAPTGYLAPFTTVAVSNEPIIGQAWVGTEPRIRVGLAAPESDFLQFRSYEDDYRVMAGGAGKGILPLRKFAVIKFLDGQYSFSGGDLEFTSADYIRLEPVNNAHAVYHVPNLISRTAKWVDPNKLFNYYRGAMEYRQGEVDKKMYIVNDLLLEDYVRGMSENSRLAPLEFVKANLAAARTYAYINRGKYPFFDVLGNTYDQLYLGYEAEAVLPNVQEAAAATRGVVVTYNGAAVTTPYFGNSNGWTKSWTSVWGGANKPWLVPVRANYDAGKRMNGHGVGMSQLDAYNRAKEEGLDYISLLKYYYTGVQVERIY